MRRLAIVCALLGTLAVTATAMASASSAGPLTVKTSVAPSWFYLADTVTARVDVLFNPRVVDASSIRVTPSFGIWSELEPERSSSSKGGAVERLSWSYTISCLTFACVPKGTTVQVFRLPPAIVAAKRLDGSSLQVSQAWPALNVAGRFLPPALPNVRPSMRIQTSVPAATYRLPPTVLAAALDVIGAVLIALGLGLAGLWIARAWIVRHPTLDTRPPLVRALALVRQAQGRQADDRRRAAGLLARTLPEDGDGLTALASEVAWSKPDPSPTRLEELARTVETGLEESS